MLRALPRPLPGCNVILQPSVFRNPLCRRGPHSFPRPFCLTSPHPSSCLRLLHLPPRLALRCLPPCLTLRHLVSHSAPRRLSLHLSLCHLLSLSPFPFLRRRSWGTGITSQLPSNSTSSPNPPLIHRMSLLRGLGSPPGLSIASPRTSAITEQCPLNQQQ